MGLIKTEEYRETAQLMTALKERFESGAEQVNIVENDQIVGVMMSQEAARKALARKVAEHWVAHPEVLDDLRDSLNQESEEWN